MTLYSSVISNKVYSSVISNKVYSSVISIKLALKIVPKVTKIKEISEVVTAANINVSSSFTNDTERLEVEVVTEILLNNPVSILISEVVILELKEVIKVISLCTAMSEVPKIVEIELANCFIKDKVTSEVCMVVWVLDVNGLSTVSAISLVVRCALIFVIKVIKPEISKIIAELEKTIEIFETNSLSKSNCAFDVCDIAETNDCKFLSIFKELLSVLKLLAIDETNNLAIVVEISEEFEILEILEINSIILETFKSILELVNTLEIAEDKTLTTLSSILVLEITLLIALDKSLSILETASEVAKATLIADINSIISAVLRVISEELNTFDKAEIKALETTNAESVEDNAAEILDINSIVPPAANSSSHSSTSLVENGSNCVTSSEPSGRYTI